MKFSGKLAGLDQLERRLERVIDETGLREQVEKSAEIVREAARARLQDGETPESHSGALAQSIGIQMDADRLDARIGTPLDHGWYLEFGTLDHPPAPWLEPAFFETRMTIVKTIADWLAHAARRARQ